MTRVIRTMVVVSALLASLPVAAQPTPPQEKEWWEGKIVDSVDCVGFALHDRTQILHRLAIQPGTALTKDAIDLEVNRLFKLGYFDPQSIKIRPERIDGKPERARVVITVLEFPHLADLQWEGLHELDESDLKGALRLQSRGAELSPYALHLDREYIISTYKSKGYHFVEVTAEQKQLGAGMVGVTWRIVEGPQVEIDEVRFSGNYSVETDTLMEQIATQESWILSGKDFVESQLVLDLDRLKLWYWMEGWQDIYQDDRIYVESLDFSSDRTTVDITIHIEEPARYSIKRVAVEIKAAEKEPGVEGKAVFTPDEILDIVHSKPGEPASDRTAEEDVKTLKARYAERAYIKTEIDHEWVQESPQDAGLLTLRLKIEEGGKTIVGRFDPVGNDRTRDDVIRRDFRDFAPGEYFNLDKLERGIQRLVDRGYFQPGSVRYEHKEGRVEGTRDVTIEVKEGNTGDLRLAAGFSSSFGFLGVIQVTQRNFDITDTPESLEDFFTGNSFVGGGQYFRLRIIPAQRRQTYIVEFREPFVFGEDFGFGFLAGDVVTRRESYTEDRRGGSISFEKRWDDLRADISFEGWERITSGLSSDAPAAVAALAGSRVLTSITPGIHWDDRDNAYLPTQGLLAEGTLQIAGPPGDFNFYKFYTDVEYHHIVVDSDERNRMQRHVLTLEGQFGYEGGYGGQGSVPITDRFYAGGRGSIRGYRFRGVGPHTNGDPVGGDVLIAGTAEYSMPFFVDFLRVAAFYDVADLERHFGNFQVSDFRHTAGLGLRVSIPILGNVPVAFDFGVPLNHVDEDEKQLFSIDIGRLF